MSEQVQVDIVFNPDTKKLEKRITEVGKDNKVKIQFEKPDVKELEGPFKELQEKAMAMANGGFLRGIGQLKEGASEFGTILKGGGDLSTAFAGGLSKIGMEGATAFAGIAAGSVAVIAGMAKLYDMSTQQEIMFKSLGVSATEYTSALNGAINAEQAFAIRNAARNVGLKLTGRQLAEMSNATDALGQRSGDLQGTQSLITQALQGNKEAMYQLGIQYSETDTEIQRATKSVDQLSSRSRQLGPKETGLFEEIGIQLSKASVAMNNQLSEAADVYGGIFRTEVQREELVQRRIAGAEEEARTQARILRDSQNRSALEAMRIQQQERLNSLAADSVRLAIEGESTAEQITRSEGESLNIQGQISRLRQIIGGSEAEQLARRAQIADLERKEAAEVSKRNQLQSFSVRLADAQRQRLVQMAIAQANHTGQNVRQLSLAEQIKMAEADRARIVALIALAGGNITEAQRQQLEGLQTLINQGRAQQAQGAEQVNNQRRQNEQAMFALRIQNERNRSLGLTVDNNLHDLQISSLLEQTQRAVNALNIENIRDQGELARRLEIRGTLLERIRAYEEILGNQQERYNRQQEIGRTRDRERGEYLVQRINLEYQRQGLIAQGYDQEFSIAEQARQNQRDGIALTQSEVSALSRYNQILAQRAVTTDLMQAQVAANEQRLANENLPLEEQNRLLQENLGLRTSIAQRTREDSVRQNEQVRLSGRVGQTIQSLSGDYKDVGDAMGGLAAGGLQQLSSGFSNMIAGAIEGKQSFGELMQEMVKSTLASLAQMASGQALFQLAMGFAKLATHDYPAATNAFISAGLFGAVGAVAGGVSAAIPSTDSAKQSSGGDSRGSSVSGASSSGSNSNQQSGPVIINFNVQPFSTREDIENAVGGFYQGYMNRR